MLNEKVVSLLNKQINKELFSAYLYLDISNYYLDEGLDGFSNWFRVQTQEERDHAMLFMEYLQNNGVKVTLSEIKAPNITFSDYKTPLDESLKHEEYITASIHTIYEEAANVKDYRTMQFLDWFIKEQGEEEKNSEDLCRKFDLFGSDSKGLFMFDSQLSSRVYAPPSLVL